MILYAGEDWKRLRVDLALYAAVWCTIAVISFVTGALVDGFAVLVPSLGLVASIAVTLGMLEPDGKVLRRRFLAIGFSVMIFLPLSLVVFGWGGTALYRSLGGLDFAGAVPFALGAGGFLGVNALLNRARKTSENQLALRGAMLVAVAAIGCAVGMELHLDELTPAIALNMLVTPATAMLAAAVIERVKRGRNTREGLATGILAGVAAAMASSAYLETVSALILGFFVGAISEASIRDGSIAPRVATPLIVGGYTGMLFLGIFGLDVGFVYSGQPLLLIHQTIIVVAGFVYAVVVSLLLFVSAPARK